MATKLSLRIHSVKCIDETGTIKAGNDEIYLGGFAVDEKAKTTNKEPFSVYAHFDPGDVKNFNPPKVFHTFTVPSTGKFPKTFSAGLVLIEKDNGDMGNAVKKLTERAKKEFEEKYLNKKKKDEEEKKPGDPPVKEDKEWWKVILEEAGREVLAFFQATIVAAFNDDLFPPHTVTVELSSKSHKFGGKTDSAEKTIDIKGQGGHYKLTYDWEFK